VIEGESRASFVMFVDNAAAWDWATSTQIEALVGQSAPVDSELAHVMGEAQMGSIGVTQRWVGYHSDPASPDGWLVQSDVAPYNVIDTADSQANVSAQTHGAWLLSTTDPLSTPRLTNQGDQGEFFHDESSGLFWCDPDLFLGQTRVEVQGWIDAHDAAGWRFASAAEVRGLVGLMSADDVALTTIMGEPQMSGATPRWIGYYDQVTQPDGLLLEARWLPERSMVSTVDTQANVSGWTHGAWVVSENQSSPVESASWTSVKGLFQ